MISITRLSIGIHITIQWFERTKIGTASTIRVIQEATTYAQHEKAHGITAGRVAI